MAFKMKHYRPFQQMESDAQQRKNLMNDNPVDSKASALNKMDPMHNGEPGVQKEDFEQFSSPMNQGKKIPFKKPKKKISPTTPKPKSMKQRIAEGKQKADAKKKSPLNNKENRAEVKAAKEGKSGKEKRQAAKAVRKQQRKEGKRGIKKTIKQVEKTVAKVKDSKVYKVGKGVADTVANVKSGRIGAAIESGKKTIADAKKKKSDSPATMKKSKY
tara:strand:+ start:416 stop:1060 length:645 start_codon:yes stop_codon:yes gene_type:complete